LRRIVVKVLDFLFRFLGFVSDFELWISDFLPEQGQMDGL